MEDFLKLRGIKLKGLKNVLLERVLEILIEEDYSTICEIRQNQLGIKVNENTLNLNTFPAIPVSVLDVNENSTQPSLVTSNHNPTVVEKSLNEEQETVEECILIEDDPIEDDLTGFFYIKHKITQQSCLQSNHNLRRNYFHLNGFQKIEMIESRHTVDGELKFDVQLQLRIFHKDVNVDSFPSLTSLYFNNEIISLTVSDA